MTSHVAAVDALTNGTVAVDYTRPRHARFTELTARCTLCRIALTPGRGQPTLRIYDVLLEQALLPIKMAVGSLIRAVRQHACSCAWSSRC